MSFQALSGPQYQHKEPSESNFDSNLQICDACGSNNIKYEATGHICGDCGLVLSELVLEYYSPYSRKGLQHSPFGRTQMGTNRERGLSMSLGSGRIKRLARLDQERCYEGILNRVAWSEIKRLLSALDLSLGKTQEIFNRFWSIYSSIQPGTKYRSIEKLVPISLYLHLKMECVVFDLSQLLTVSHISKRDFGKFMFQLRVFLKEYLSRDRKEYILRLIWNFCESQGLSVEFYYQVRKVFRFFWKLLENTKDSVIAATCCSLLALCDPEYNLKVAPICNHFGIEMSTVHRQVESKIINRFPVEGFQSLVRSSHLLQELMKRLNLIGTTTIKDAPRTSMIKIKLGTSKAVFNFNKSIEYYFLMLKIKSKGEILVPHFSLNNTDKEIHANFIRKRKNNFT